jgi:3-oxosteroid 1-dehydrogenase
MKTEDQVIPGLYGAGTAITARPYWGGGAIKGQAITTGYIAGINAAEEPAKEVQNPAH